MHYEKSESLVEHETETLEGGHLLVKAAVDELVLFDSGELT